MRELWSRRIVVNYTEDIGSSEAIRHVAKVIAGGRISVGAKGKKHYCWLTIFNGGTVVSVTPKYNTDSDIFYVYRKTE